MQSGSRPPPAATTPYLVRQEGAVHARCRADWEHRLTQLLAGGLDPVVPTLDVPAWPFLCHLADVHGLLLHGSGDPGIDLFEPRQAQDQLAFGNRHAVFAASDGIWALFYAILDRSRCPLSMVTCCYRVASVTGQRSWLYYFSITRSALVQRPWRRGTVYLLPREGFAQECGGSPSTGLSMQWASPRPIRPLARVGVGPEDFPFLEQVRGHEDHVLWARMRDDPTGFPWADGEGDPASGR